MRVSEPVLIIFFGVMSWLIFALVAMQIVDFVGTL